MKEKQRLCIEECIQKSIHVEEEKYIRKKNYI